jgi:phosphate/phosphite/phosphonate ABC transporter binding protein
VSYQFSSALSSTQRFRNHAPLKVLLAILLSLLAIVGVAPARAEHHSPAPLRIGLTPTFPNDQYRALEDWRRYLEHRLGRKVEFVRRDSYVETMDLLRLQKIDFAWICDYPFVHFKGQTRLLAVPVYEGRPSYYSYLIVPATDRDTTSIAQLKGRVFAYADPYSNTGYLTPRFRIHQLGEDPSRFFSMTFFTWGHRKTIEAVAAGLADGASVSNHVWDTLAKTKPELVAATRVVDKSPEYGFAPFVARSSIGEVEFDGMQRALLAMAQDERGRKLLAGLNLDGFIAGDLRLYARVEQMIRTLGKPCAAC